MKKLFFALLMALPLGVAAQEISEDVARQTAARFLDSKVRNGSLRSTPAQIGNLELAWASTLKNEAPEVYVFNLPDEGGFVIVAGDEASPRRVLGWSDSGSFDIDNMPPALRYLSAQYVADIAVLREEGSAGRAVRAKSAYAATSGYGEVKPLLKTQWNQEAGYNDLLPDYPTGCVATAIAQIMNYHQWPKHGYGRHTNKFLEKQGIDQTVDFSQSVYDWEGMRKGDSQAISKLMYDVGCAVNMQYTPGESGANDFDALLALVTNFGYDEKTIGQAGRSATTLRDELRAGRPVFVVGQDTVSERVWIDGTHSYKKFISDSHAMVCDGFSDDGLFHFNIGWGGQGDGYYTLDRIRPNGDDDLKHSYAPLMDFIYGIQPGEKTCVEGVWYDLDEEAGTATMGSGGYEGDVTVPEQFTYEGKVYTVNAVYPYALTERRDDDNVITNLTFNAAVEEFPARFVRRGTIVGEVENVSFGGGVRRIAPQAFYGMKSLKSAKFGDSVESIGTEAFRDCSALGELVLGNGLTEIADFTFDGCMVDDLDVPASVKRIGKHGVVGRFNSVIFHGPIELDTCAITTFYGIDKLEGLEHCTRIAYHGLTNAKGTFTPNPNATYDRYAITGTFDKIIIPADRTEYDYTTALETKEFYVEPGNPNYASCGGALYSKDMKTLIALPLVKDDGTLENYDRYIPMGITDITDQPVGKSYMFLYLPPSLQRIHGGAIGGYNISRVTCMSAVPPVFDEDRQTEIQYNAELHVPVGSEEAYAKAPVWSKFNFIVGDMVADDQYVYQYKKGDNSARIIGRNTESFTGHDFVLPSVVELDGEKLRIITYEPSLFQGDPTVESVTLGAFIDGVTYKSFKNCGNLKRVKIEGEIYAIDNNAFENCTSLETVEISRTNQLSDLGERMFYGCTSLKTVDLTSQEPYFMNFGKSAFEGCTSLVSVKGLSNVSSLPERTFANSGIETFHIGAEMYSFENSWDESQSPFAGCERLHTFTVDPENEYFYAADGVLYYYSQWDSYPWQVKVCPPRRAEGGKVEDRTVLNLSEKCDIISIKMPATLREVIIPATVKNIQWAVFSRATGIEKVTVLREDPNFVSGDMFDDSVYGKATLQVPKGAKEAYAAHNEWKRFANIVEIDPEDYPSPEAIKAKADAEHEAAVNAPDDPAVGNALEIVMQTGKTHFIYLQQQPIITFGGNGELNITGRNLGLSLPIADIKYYHFGTYDLLGIDSADEDRVNLDFTEGDLKVSGLKAGEKVTLYDLQGRMVRDVTVGADGTVSMALSGMSTAVYVLKVNDATYKILKK